MQRDSPLKPRGVAQISQVGGKNRAVEALKMDVSMKGMITCSIVFVKGAGTVRDNPKILKNLSQILRVLRLECRRWKAPVAGTFNVGPNAPFRVLISTILSLRTKDAVTEKASHSLLASAETPATLLNLNQKQIEKLIYPVGFYRTKAKNILQICRILLERFEGKTPDEIEVLLTLPGVGRKTANLVVTVGYNKPGICVDTHVHRISNRWGLVKTKTPDQTEAALRIILPRKYWIGFNDTLVSYGQNLCVPISPFCSRCKIRIFCPQIDVSSRR